MTLYFASLGTVYPKKYAHGFCFAVLCCGYTFTDFPISIRLTSLALWQSNDCPSASKATLMNMDKYFMWIHYERLHNHNKAKHNKTVCIFLGIYCMRPSNFMLGYWTLFSFVIDWKYPVFVRHRFVIFTFLFKSIGLNNHMPMMWRGLFCFGYLPWLMCNVITDRCPNLNGCLYKPPFWWGYRWWITSQAFMKMHLLINTLTSVLRYRNNAHLRATCS